MSRPPPTSTLFPYTTLFRSRVQRDLVGHPVGAHLLADPPHVGLIDLAHREPGQPDRKSTRLNSSHMSISYAVFCLKKKKKNQRVNRHMHQTITHPTPRRDRK